MNVILIIRYKSPMGKNAGILVSGRDMFSKCNNVSVVGGVVYEVEKNFYHCTIFIQFFLFLPLFFVRVNT